MERIEEGLVRGYLHRPEGEAQAALALAHGAGSDADAPLLVGVAREFARLGWLVLRYDLPFRQQRPHGPPSPAHAARDREGIRAAMALLRATRSAGHIYAGGHSYGGRQTSMLAAEDDGLADALLLLSYPLHPPRKPAELRTGHFPELRIPALFVHGTRDPFATIEELTAAIALIPARTHLLPLDRAGHDLKPAIAASAAIASQLAEIIATDPRG